MADSEPGDRYRIERLSEKDAVRCPCGLARRAFADDADGPASIHVVDISGDSEAHYHKHHTEIYYVLDGEGHVELDGEKVPVGPGTAILMEPGCRHRAVGALQVLNICIPPFDPRDEHFDESTR